jgi:hypothetical protein
LPVAIDVCCHLDWKKPKTVGFEASEEESTKARIKRHPTQVYEETFHLCDFLLRALALGAFLLGLGLPT